AGKGDRNGFALNIGRGGKAAALDRAQQHFIKIECLKRQEKSSAAETLGDSNDERVRRDEKGSRGCTWRRIAAGTSPTGRAGYQPGGLGGLETCCMEAGAL